MDLKDQKYMAALAGEVLPGRPDVLTCHSQPFKWPATWNRNSACHWSYAPGRTDYRSRTDLFGRCEDVWKPPLI